MAIFNIANNEATFAALTLHDGDTVNIAAGTSTWVSGHTVSVGIVLSGSGKSSTIITRDSGISGSLITFNLDATPLHISGIGWATNDVSSSRPTTFNNWVSLKNGGNSFTNAAFCLELCDFTTGPGTATVPVGLLQGVNVGGSALGVVRNNTFNMPTNAEIIHNEGQSLPGTEPTGGAPALLDWGNQVVQSLQLFVENNTFTNNVPQNTTATTNFFGCSAIQNYYGARCTFRFNTLNFCQFDAHGGASLANIGTRYYEIYSNTCVVPAASGGQGYNQSQFMALRDGTGYVYNNILNVGAGNPGIAPNIELVKEYTGWNGGAYPQLYQIGQGLLSGAATAPTATVSALYIWNNNGGNTVPPLSNQGPSGDIQSGRDYFYSGDSSAAPSMYSAFTYPYPWGNVITSPVSINTAARPAMAISRL